MQVRHLRSEVERVLLAATTGVGDDESAAEMRKVMSGVSSRILHYAHILFGRRRSSDARRNRNSTIDDLAVKLKGSHPLTYGVLITYLGIGLMHYLRVSTEIIDEQALSETEAFLRWLAGSEHPVAERMLLSLATDDGDMLSTLGGPQVLTDLRASR